jgi:hypothetical protein
MDAGAAFILHDVEGFEHNEVAKLLGVSEGTVEVAGPQGTDEAARHAQRRRGGFRGAGARPREWLHAMTCLDLELDIGDYVDGTLDASSVARVESHLRHCRSCQAIVHDLRTLRGAARSLEPQIPPAHVWPRIGAAIEADARQRSIRRLFSFGAISLQPALSPRRW